MIPLIPEMNGYGSNLTKQRKLFGSMWLEVQAVLQPGEFRVWNTFSMAVQAGSHTRFLGLSLWIDQDYWRH